MARTAAGAALTERHRQGQLQIRARAVQDFVRIWPLWQGDERSFQRLLQASLPLLRAHHRLSATLASSYYRAFRVAERVGGASASVLGSPLDEQRALGTLHLTGAEMTSRAIRAGHSPQAAMQTALVRTSGTVSRLALAGGRDALVLSTAADGKAQGWSRVTSGNPCPFCESLANGVVTSESTADFQAHDHCSCSAEAQFN